MNIRLAIIISSFFLASENFAQQNWELARSHEGIKVFLKSAERSNIKMLRVETDLPASLDAVVALLLDLPASEKWIPQTKSWRYIRRMSPTEFIYHSEIKMPWPVWNRDFVIHAVLTQNPVTRVVTMDDNAVDGEVPEREDVVRIKLSKVKWVLYPLPNNKTRLVYELFTDPGGSIPTSIVNYFAKQAAIDIIKKMREMVQEAPYKDADLPFVK